MPETAKRKQPSSGDNSFKSVKRSKGSRGAGVWQTPHQKAKFASLQARDVALDVGDKGIWVTFARGMDGKAISEFNLLCEEYGTKLYGLVPASENVASDEDEEDIEASIKKELDCMNSGDRIKYKRNFKAIRSGIECVFFMKTRDPIEPVELCRRICHDASLCTDLKERKTKYINRLTPVIAVDKASDNGLVRLARKALAPWFNLVADEATRIKRIEVTHEGANIGLKEEETRERNMPVYTYAIRPSIRSNNSVERDNLIKQIASVVDQRHNVNLTNPDKVVLVDVFQSFCGISVIDGSDWNGLKRFNINELYKSSPGARSTLPATKADEAQAS